MIGRDRMIGLEYHNVVTCATRYRRLVAGKYTGT